MLALLFVPLASAQKDWNAARKLLKEGKAAEALKKVEAMEADTSLAAEKLPRVFDLGKEAHLRQNTTISEKIYLKQPYDTLAYFRSLLGMARYALKCDSAEVALETKKPRYRERNRTLLRKHYKNLGVAGVWLFQKGNYAGALPYLQTYVDMPSAPLFRAGDLDTGERSRRAYMLLESAFREGRYTLVKQYKEAALGDTLHRAGTWERLALTALAEGDTAAYRNYLENGTKEFPDVPLFFTRLSDYYNERGQHQEALDLADALLERAPGNLYILLGKALAEMNLKDYEACILTSGEILQQDPNAAEAHFLIGACYCNLAAAVSVPVGFNAQGYDEAKQEVASYYRSAQPYMETYRRLAPDAERRWAPLLYRIYLNLNLGAQFEEIDALLKALGV